ncbi:hypothetical protein [Lysobacter xanthus]
MKILAVVAMLTLVAACTPRHEGVAARTVYALPARGFALDGQVRSMPELVASLGASPSVPVNIAMCRGSSRIAVLKLAQALEAAGFSRIGVITTANQRACANNSSKPTPLRGAA